ncbi:MAG: fatty acid desaturase [Fuerstiella sp.]
MSVTQFTEEELSDLEDEVTLPLYILFPLGVLGLYSLAFPWPVNTLPVYLGWLAFTTFVFFCYTSCFHETAHQTLSQSARLSVLVGRVLGTAMFTPYSVYRECHIRHHAYLNKPTDFELWPYSDPNMSLWFRRLFVWLDLAFGFLTGPFVYGRTFFHRDSPIRSAAVRRAVYWEYAAIVAVWGTVLTLCAVYNLWFYLLTVWVLPHWLAGIMQTGRKLTEHLGMSSYDPLKGTRTVVADNWFTRLCTWMNFDIFVHGPHHRHPKVAHNLLHRKMKEYKESTHDEFPIYSTYRTASLAMLPYLFRNPGVGMNAGAASPDAEKLAEVDNFVADVATEVLADTDVETKVAQQASA